MEFKDSGIAWIGQIPKHWEIKKAKFVFKNKKEIIGYRAEFTDRLALTLNGVIKRSKDDNEGLQPEKFETYQILRKNNLVFKLIDLKNISTSRVGISNFDFGIVSPAYIILQRKENNKFFYYFYMSMYYRCIFNSLGDDGVRSSLNVTELLNLKIPYPPLDEQKKIAEFLDKKCEIIDKKVENLERKINTLKEYKKSLISECVTKGLNPRILEFKDSKIPWIGQIPKHWKISKIKYNLQRFETKNQSDKEVLSVYREFGVIPKNSRDDNHNVTSDDTSNYKYVKKGYFVINKMKAWQGSMGVSDYEGIVSPAYFIYKFTNSLIFKKYFHYLLRNCYKDEFRRISGGIREGQWDLSAIEFNNTLIILPPLNAQKEIAEFLDKKCEKIDRLNENYTKQIITLKEYKKSLIYECVTGKKEI